MTDNLNERTLTLTDRLETKELADGTRLLKQTDRATYLALKPGLFSVLTAFDGARTVQQVLLHLLRTGAHPDIKAFYDLVTESARLGFLVDRGSADSGSRLGPEAAPWAWGWPAPTAKRVSLLFAFVGICGFLSAFLSGDVLLPTDTPGLVAAAAMTACILSIAGMLAGCVLHGSGRSVYELRQRWDRGVPYLGVDTRDAFMGGRECEVAVALQALATPLVVAAASRVLNSPPGLFASLLALLLLSFPFGGTPACDLLHALFRKSHQLPHCTPAFVRRKLVHQLLNWRQTLAEDNYVTFHAAYAIFWLGVVIKLAAGFIDRQGSDLVYVLVTTPSVGATLEALVVFGLLAAMAVVPVICQVLVLVHNATVLLAPVRAPAERRVRRRPSGTARKPGQAETVEFLKSTLLFAPMRPEHLNELVEHFEFTVVRSRTTVIRERDRGDALFVVYSGEVSVLREDGTGHEREIARLREGDVFGEIALLEDVPRTASVVSLTEAELLVLDRETFDRLVVSSLGAGEVKTIIQTCGFLRRSELFSGLSDRAIVAVAHEFVHRDIPEGTRVVTQGDANDRFYLVYDGEFGVERDGEQKAVLRQGDFFGEISLLRDVPATATVAARSASRCLTLDRGAFYGFLSSDAFAGYMIAQTAERREAEG